MGLIISHFFKLIQYVKRILWSSKIQNRLTTISLILLASVILSTYLLSQGIISNLIIQNQADFESNSFKQTGKYIKSVFENINGNIQKIDKRQIVHDSLSFYYNSADINQIYKKNTILDTELYNVFINSSYLDTIILLGKNNFPFVYVNESRSTGAYYAGSDLDFYSFCSRSGLLAEGSLNTPVYWTDSKITPKGNVENQINSIMKNKMIFTSVLKDDNNPTALIIIVFKKSFFKELMSDSSQQRQLLVLDSRNSPVWSNNPHNISIEKYLSFSGNSGYFIKPANGTKYLITYSSVYPYKFTLISMIPTRAIMPESTKINVYTLIFSSLCFLFASIVSYFFSKRLLGPLHILAGRLSKDVLITGETLETDPRILFRKYSLRKKIIIFFAVTVIVPSILYILMLFYSNYITLKDKISELAFATFKQVESNIAYTSKNYYNISSQIVFDETIQNLLNSSKTVVDIDRVKDSLDKQISAIKMTKKELQAFALYLPDGKKLYSTSYNFDNTPEKLDEKFISKIQSDRFNLKLIEAPRDTGINPSICFAANILSTAGNYGSCIGYIVFFIDQDPFSSITNAMKFGDSGYFFIMDKNGNMLMHENEDISSSILKSVNYSQKMELKPSGSISAWFENENYELLYDTLPGLNLNTLGIIPFKDIMSKVLPLIWYSIILLLAYALTILFFSSLISLGIVKPLHKLSLLMNEVNNGNFDIYMNYKGGDEIAILTNQFNNMIQRTQTLIYQNYQSKLRESELLFLEKEAQLNALQQQINPHFLYNTLESIKWLAYEKGVMEICDMATSLVKFFRGSITKGKEFVTFAEEVEHLKSYLHIQEIRFQERFSIQWEIETEVMKCKTIKLILQPIVENAINHGLDSIESGGLILIRGYKEDDGIHFEVIDNGVGMTPEQLDSLIQYYTSPQLEADRDSIGLSNVYRRLKLYYGDECRFDIESEKGVGTTVRLVIPIK